MISKEWYNEFLLGNDADINKQVSQCPNRQILSRSQESKFPSVQKNPACKIMDDFEDCTIDLKPLPQETTVTTTTTTTATDDEDSVVVPVDDAMSETGDIKEEETPPSVIDQQEDITLAQALDKIQLQSLGTLLLF